MKVIVISTCYPRRSQPNHGIFIHQQIRGLAALGVNCYVLQPIDWSPPPPLHRLHSGWQHGRAEQLDMLDEVDGIPLYHPRIYRPLPSRFFPGDYWERTGRGLARYLSQQQSLRSADLLYAHFLCHEGYAGLMVKRLLGMPLVAIARGDDVHGWPLRWPDRQPKLAAVLKEADGLLACSQGIAQDAAKWATEGLSAKIEVVYNGVEGDRFFPAESASQKTEARVRFNLPMTQKLLLCVATTIAEKGWLDLFDAFAALPEPFANWHLVMIGTRRGNGDLNLETETQKRGIGPRAHWLGILPPEQMPDLYRAADAFALASHNEGLANSMMEAMATGLPVIVTDVGGHSEMVSNGVQGRLVARQDVEGLREALTEVLSNETYARRMGEAARARALAVGDHHHNAKRLLAYFERVLTGQPRGAVTEAIL